MTTYDDWLRLGDPGRLAAQFHLTGAEVEKARAALAPAFAFGFQKAMESPARWSELSRAFLSMIPGQAAGAPPGETVVDALFGTPDLRQAIARQAAAATGLAPDILMRMMPDLAAFGFEAMARNAMATMMRHQPEGLATGDFGSATAEMMRRGANAVEAMTRPSDEGRPGRSAGHANPMSPAFYTDAFANAVQTGFGLMAGGLATGKPAGASPANPVLPFATLFEAFAKGLQTAADATPVMPKASPSAASLSDDDPARSFFSASRQMHEEYLREMKSLFDKHSTSPSSKD